MSRVDQHVAAGMAAKAGDPPGPKGLTGGAVGAGGRGVVVLIGLQRPTWWPVRLATVETKRS